MKAEDKLKIQELIQRMGVDIQLATGCDKISQHKTTMVPPSALKENGIKFAKVSIVFHLIVQYVSFHLLSGDSTSRPVYACILGSTPCCHKRWLQ